MCQPKLVPQIRTVGTRHKHRWYRSFSYIGALHVRPTHLTRIKEEQESRARGKESVHQPNRYRNGTSLASVWDARDLLETISVSRGSRSVPSSSCRHGQTSNVGLRPQPHPSAKLRATSRQEVSRACPRGSRRRDEGGWNDAMASVPSMPTEGTTCA